MKPGKAVQMESRSLDVHTSPQDEARGAIERLREIVRETPVAMLTTTDARGHLRSRPMVTHQSELDDELWVYVDARSGVIDDMTVGHQVNVALFDKGGRKYVSIAGVGHIVRDTDLLRKFWDRRAAEWFPEGPEADPHLALLRIQLEEAAYWDMGAKTIVKLRGLARTVQPQQPPLAPTTPAYEAPTTET